MRTKEQLIEDLKHIDLHNTPSEPVVSSSVQLQGGVWKCCLYFYRNTSTSSKHRERYTINLTSSSKRSADKEAFELEQRCQEAIHLCFISLSKHDFLESIEKWVIASDTSNRVEITTIATMYEKLKVVKRYEGFLGLTVEDFKQSDINKFCDWALDKGSRTGGSLARETVKGVRQMVNTFFNFAVSRDIIIRNPCAGTEVPKRRDDDNEDKKEWLDEEEYWQFRDWLDEQVQGGRYAFRKLIEITDIEVYTGMRREELFGLKWNCLDWDNQLLYTGGARVKAGSKEVYKKTLKTKSSHRVYTLTDDIIEIFKCIMNRHIALGIYDTNGFIFVHEHSKGRAVLGKPLGVEASSKLFKQAILDCPYISDKSLHLYSLRHTCCTLMFKLGYDKAEIQNWIGHEEGSRITETVYNHYKPVLHKERLQRLSNIVRKHEFEKLTKN